MTPYKSLKVNMNNRHVGTLGINNDGIIAFEYSSSWLDEGFSISPLSLPLKKGVFLPKISNPFNGLFGVFNDSLPDGWGRLLVDRFLLNKKIVPNEIGVLNRLAIVGSSGMGALCYEPEYIKETKTGDYNLDELSLQCSEILNSKTYDNLDNLFIFGSSSGGARPKILVKIDGEDWIIKFKGSMDKQDCGKEEYNYNLVAKSCGLDIPHIKLFPSKICSGYFGVKRFDRQNNNKIHMISASALLETSHRTPNLDYNTLMKLTMLVTKNFEDIEKLFRLMVFNVFSHNRDDHSKNFSYLYNEDKKTYTLSPAYDLTYSSSLNGEHATTINGEGKSPTETHLLAVANNINMNKHLAENIIDEIKSKTIELQKDI